MFLPISEKLYLARDNYNRDQNPNIPTHNQNSKIGTHNNTHLRYRTIIISDTHLGRLAANAEFLFEFLLHAQSERLIIAGDGIDGWAMEADIHRPFPEMHARCLDALNAKAANGTDIIDLRGNHDEKKATSRYKVMNKKLVFKSKCKGLESPITFAKSYVHTDARNRRILVLHGDVFDNWQKKSWMKKIAETTDFLYEPIVRCSNAFRKAVINLTGFDISIVAPLKAGTKWLVGAVKSFDDAVAKNSIRQKFDGVVCGHIHHAKIRETDDFIYMNSGDWVESCRCLVETFEGDWQILVWSDERRKLGLKKLPTASDINPFQSYRSVTQRQITLIHRVWPGEGRISIARQKARNTAAEKMNSQQQKALPQGNFRPEPLPVGV